MSEFTNFVERFEKKVDNMNQKIDNARQAALFLDPRVASVDGIYITSQAVRRQALSFIWAKYNMLPDNLTQSLGRLYDAVEEIYLPDKNEKSLFNYTHDKSSVYSRSIAEKNLTVKDGNVQRSVTETPKDAYNSWYKTAYQGKNYYDILDGYNESFGEETKITYNDDHTLNSIGDSGYVAIDYEKEIDIEYTSITAATQSSYEDLKSYKRPRKKDFGKGDTFNDAEYNAALDEWKTKKTKDRKKFRKGKKDAKDEYRENLEEQNSFIREPKTLLTKTSKLFKENKIESLVTRTFGINTNTTFIDTSVNKLSGRSRGRNLRKKDEDTLFPFCRAWVAHHQYGIQKNSLIRPFDKDIEQSELVQYFRSENGGEYLHDYSVLKNGFVKITPDNLGNDKYDTKRCMFSIENLAWKDVRIQNELNKDQIGPNGGRIMWFPPYDLSFQESSQAQWNETNFIGRGEPIYTYTNTRRTGSLSFTLLIDHPSIMNIFEKRANKDTSDSENGDDNDILRFFAGCDIPMKMDTNYDSSQGSTGNTPSEEYIVTSKECKTINISIYFPNNYSGHFDNVYNPENDWDEYLFGGNGVNVVEVDNPDKLIGYEMCDSGISQDTSEYQECNINDNDLAVYFYRHDKDKCQNLSERNRKDTCSYRLNSDNKKEEGRISFAELFLKMNKDNEKYAKYGKSLGLLDDKNEFTNDTVNQLNNLGKYNIKVTGVATSQDSRGSQTMAERRLNTVVRFLKFNKGTLFNGEENHFNTGTTIVTVSDTNVNSENSKKGRRVEIEITYNLPEVEGNSLAINQTAEERIEMILTRNTTATTPNESDYFLNLEKIDNFAYQKIKEKIKYFEPAYHSISPEGFNSRLTFLHQCTRQGHTLERDPNDPANISSTAGNMAFGRPPFCVLRIGDFINTKIVIRSLNIVYQNGNGMQWDMNPEGIGVQPMFAKVTMQIEIIGGQSLDAPVSRLNNAVSFNYYANTGVYDNRADRAIYNGTGITYSDLYEAQRINTSN